MNREQIREQLRQAAEADYKVYNSKLLPGVSGIQGVRLPKLREIAKRTAAQDAEGYLRQMRRIDWADAWYEEKMLYGLVIGYAKMDDNQYRQWLDTFVPLIDNWGVCDSCCMTYKWMRKQPAYWWDYLQQWIQADTEFSVRFAVVSMMGSFVDDTHIQEIFTVCSNIQNDGYYAKMAVAWLLSVCFVKFPDETFVYLLDDKLDCFTHNKSIQKTCESYRVSKEWKEKLRSLRRKDV